MQGAYYESVGSASAVIRLGERPAPQPGPGEVRIRIHASGVNPSDVKARAGARGMLTHPYVIPHSDGAGIIDSIGDGADPRRIGAHVISTVSSADKAAHARSAGADHVINYREQDVVTAIIAATASGGAAYASTAVPTPSLPFYSMMFNHTTVQMLVVYLLGSAERRRACALINEALEACVLTHPSGARFALRDTAQAHVAVESGSVIGNVIVTVD